MSLYQIPSIQARYSSDSNRPPNEKMGKPWAPIECPLYEPFSGLLCGLQAPVSALRPRVCSLSVSGLAVKNSANVENRKETSWYAITQRRRYEIKSIFSMIYRYVLEVVSDVLYLAIFDDANRSFVLSMMKRSWYIDCHLSKRFLYHI